MVAQAIQSGHHLLYVQRAAHAHVDNPGAKSEDRKMLHWAIVFLIIGLIAGALGFTGVAGAAVGIAKFLFFLFLAVFVMFLILGVTIFRRVRGE